MKRLYDVMKDCKKEEEVKSEFCKFFKMKINALKAIDHYTESVLFEFKCDRNFRSPAVIATVIAQTMYYARRLKKGLVKYPLPPHICVVDRNEAFFLKTRTYAPFYASTAQFKYDWDRAPSTPCPNLVKAIEEFPALKDVYVYDLRNPAQDDEFVAKCREYLTTQTTFLDQLDKKSITEDNFLEVFEYWDSLFGSYVRDDERKSSEYFLADIEQGRSIKGENGQVLFNVDGTYVPKTLKPKDYEHFWQNYEKVDLQTVMRIRQKADRISEDVHRRFTGEFYTPIDFAHKGLEYVGRELKAHGQEWWESGEYRFWDMAAGTGNLEFGLPSAALKYCYISTLEADEAQYCRKIFPDATCFQYNYLEDDIPHLAGELSFATAWKLPPNLVADLANPKIKWIIFINPPFATANKVCDDTGKESKDAVAKTTIRSFMHKEGYGEASRELFTQFLFRISKEFAGKDAHLGMFSPLKYLNSNNDQKIRDGFFQYAYNRGFIFPSRCFSGTTADFPVGFLVWNLSKRQHLKDQTISLDVFNDDVEKVGTKVVPSVERSAMLNKWVPRPKWDGSSIMPTLTSGIKVMQINKDKRNHVAPGFLCSVCSKGDDFQNQNSVFILSAPYANAGAFSVTPENFERAMVLYTVKKLPEKNWWNDKDVFYAPSVELPDEFVSDCAIWGMFSGKNNTAALRDVACGGRVWQIRNNLYPFLLDEVKTWTCTNTDLAAQISMANEDRYLATWLKDRPLSSEAQAVMAAGRALYRAFYAEIVNTNWMEFKIATWDVGYYQICQALKGTGIAEAELAALRSAHEALKAKLLPKVYEYGFLNPDVQKFEENPESAEKE